MNREEGALRSYAMAQTNYEFRFSCAICMCAKLRMIYGSCQHRLCEDCLYTKNGSRRANLAWCPFCQKQNAFPMHRPCIPEDNVEMQKQLGVASCPNKGCLAEMWSWELTEHLTECRGKILLPKLKRTCDKKEIENDVNTTRLLRSISSQQLQLNKRRPRRLMRQLINNK